MQACGEPPPEIVNEMSSAIGAELPAGLMGGGGGGGGGGGPGQGDLEALPSELLGMMPDDLRNCPVQ
jgi:hypothetical protein